MTLTEKKSLLLAVGGAALLWILKKAVGISGVGSFPGGDNNKLPTVSDYSRLLDIAQNKFGISREQARKKYGLYTIGQWKKLLGI